MAGVASPPEFFYIYSIFSVYSPTFKKTSSKVVILIPYVEIDKVSFLESI
jgi:hypothetical protein